MAVIIQIFTNNTCVQGLFNMYGGTFDCIVCYNHDTLTVWENFIATKDDNWPQC